MEKENKYYMEYLNHNHNWLKTITIEIYKFLIDREYITLLMQMYIQWIKDNGSTSSSVILIIPRLPHFDKPPLQKFQLYIQAQIMTQCFLCRNCKKTVFIQAIAGKEKGFLYFTHVKDPYWFAELK